MICRMNRFILTEEEKASLELQHLQCKDKKDSDRSMKELIEGQYDMLLIFDEKIDSLDIQIEQISEQNEVCQRLQQIEGIGPITTLAIIALVGHGQGFKNGLHFSAYLGLVPRQHSSGQKEKLLGISKRGDVYLRELLIHGGRSVVMHCSKKSDARSI